MRSKNGGVFMGLWTLTHLYTVIPAFIAFFIIGALMAWALKNKSERIKYIPLQVIAVILLGLEIGKQIVSFEGGYDLYSLPFHYCSLFLYLLPIHAFYHGRFKAQIGAVTFACLSSLFFFMLVMPAIVYGEAAILNMRSSYMDFHTVVFHNLVCLYFVLTLSLKLYEMKVKRDLILMASFLGVYVIIAAILSNTLEVNFHNLYRCNIALVEDLRAAVVASIGWLGQLIYNVIMFVLTIIFAYAAYFFVMGALALYRLLFRRIA